LLIIASSMAATGQPPIATWCISGPLPGMTVIVSGRQGVPVWLAAWPWWWSSGQQSQSRPGSGSEWFSVNAIVLHELHCSSSMKRPPGLV
jgi:hypothetical protein